MPRRDRGQVESGSAVRRSMWAAPVVLASIVSTAPAAEYGFNPAVTSTAWLNWNNWVTVPGGTAGTAFPGTDLNATSTADGTATDVASIGAVGFSGNNLGINFNSSTNTGRGSNSGANGQLTLGTIQMTAAAAKDVNVGASASTAGTSAILALNGSTIGTTANTILANLGGTSSATRTLTLAPYAGGASPGLPMTVQLNAATNVVQVNPFGNVTISSVIGQASGVVAGLTVNSVGNNGGVLALTTGGTSTFTGAITINGGATLSTGNTLAINGNSTANRLIINDGGTFRFTGSSYTLPKGITLNGGTNTIQTTSLLAGNSLLANGSVTGSGTLVKTGPGQLALNNTNNSFTGGVVVSAGTLRVTQVGGLGASGLTGPGGTAVVDQINSGATLSFGTTIVYSGARSFLLAGPPEGGTSTVSVDSGSLVTLSSNAVLNGAGNFTKSGDGVLRVTSQSTYAGGTSIVGGTLRADNAVSATGTGAVAIAAGGTLAGTGRVTGPVAVNGKITAGSGAAAPASAGGASADVPGTLTTGDQTWANGGSYVWKTTASSGTAGTTWDLLNIGTLTATGGSFLVQAILGTTAGGSAGTFTPPTNPMTYQLAHTTNTADIDVEGLFTLNTDGLNVPADAGTFTLSFDPSTGTGGGYDLNLNFQAAPEPTTAALVGLAAASLLGRRRRKVGAGTSVLGLLHKTR